MDVKTYFSGNTVNGYTLRIVPEAGEEAKIVIKGKVLPNDAPIGEVGLIGKTLEFKSLEGDPATIFQAPSRESAPAGANPQLGDFALDNGSAHPGPTKVPAFARMHAGDLKTLRVYGQDIVSISVR